MRLAAGRESQRGRVLRDEQGDGDPDRHRDAASRCVEAATVVHSSSTMPNRRLSLSSTDHSREVRKLTLSSAIAGIACQSRKTPTRVTSPMTRSAGTLGRAGEEPVAQAAGAGVVAAEGASAVGAGQLVGDGDSGH